MLWEFVSQFMHDPRVPHLEDVYRILHYLELAPGKGIYSLNNHLKLEAYTPCRLGWIIG